LPLAIFDPVAFRRSYTNMALEQPKKPVGGAYGQFLADKRAEFTKQCAGQKASAISTLAGEKWKTISDTEKSKYQTLYEQVRTKFDADMAKFIAAGGEKSKGAAALRNEKRKAKEGGGKKVKDANKPKKPAGGAYGSFLAKNRAAFQKQCPGSITGVAKLAGQKWKELSDTEKAPFEKEYKAKLAEYQEAMKSYVPPAGADGDDDEDEGGEDDAAAPPAKKTKVVKAKVASA